MRSARSAGQGPPQRKRRIYPSERRLSTRQAVLWGSLSGLLLLVVWQLGYRDTIFVPSPRDVFARLLELASDPETWSVLLVSLRRLLMGLGIGVLLAFVAAIVGLREDSRRLVTVLIQVAFSLPSLMVGLLALIIFGLSEVGVVLAVGIIVFPFIATPTMEGVRTIDPALLGMAKVYHANLWDRFWRIVVPHVTPYLISGVRNGHALAWRVLIVVEIFSVRSGLGFKFERAFELFQFPEVFSYLALMLVVMFAVEYGVLRPVEDHAGRWRHQSGRRRRASEQDRHTTYIAEMGV